MAEKELNGRCSRCNELGLRSTVTGGDYGVSTCMGSHSYFSEDGQRHDHDPNHTTYTYKCSQGHEWNERVRRGCPAKGCSDRGSRSVTYKSVALSTDTKGEANA